MRMVLSYPPTSAKAVKRCGLGAVIAAAYQLTNDFDVAHRLGHEALHPHYGAATTPSVFLQSIVFAQCS
jgi:hypothetical protein